MADTTLPPEKRLQVNVVTYGNFLKQKTVNANERGVKLVSPITVGRMITAMEVVDAGDLMEAWIGNSHNHWMEIADRNIVYFKKHSFDIFGGLKDVDNVKHHIDAFTELLDASDSKGEKIFSSSDIETQWKYFQSFAAIAIKYIHFKRGPTVIVKPDGTKVPRYTKSFHNEVRYDADGGRMLSKLGMKPLVFDLPPSGGQ